MNELELLTINALRELEIPAHVVGYKFIKTAMQVISENPDAIHQITKVLYPTIAERHNTTWKKVERGIRHALASTGSDLLTQKKVIGTARELYNSEFLATLHESMMIKFAEDTLASNESGRAKQDEGGN